MSLATSIQKLVYQQMLPHCVALTMSTTVSGNGADTTGDTTTTQTVQCLISPASGGTIQAFDSRFDRGTLIETNLRAIKVPAYGLTFAPGPGDTLATLEGGTWKVLGCTPLSYAGTVIAYDLTVKR